jgi:protoheme IX farnesyltransferase
MKVSDVRPPRPLETRVQGRYEAEAPAVEADGGATAAASPSSLSAAGLWRFLQDALTLTKARVALLVLLTTAGGFLLGARAAGVAPDGLLLTVTLLGTGLVAAGASVWNQVLERERDGRMERTRERPLAAGRLTATAGALIGVALAVAGLLVLLAASGAAALLGAATFTSYVFLYTPLKPRTHLATLVGAVPGALPPLIGWSAALPGLGPPAWSLFAVLFLWQVPHFLAIAWLYRDDYARGGYPFLAVTDPSGAATARRVIAYSLLLVPASLLPAAAGVSGALYVPAALGLGAVFLGLALWLALARTERAARALLLGSVAYLSFLWLALLADFT